MRPYGRALLATASLILALLPGCVTSTQATRLQKDLDDVKRQVFQVQQDTAGSRAQIEDLSKKLPGGGGTPESTADLQAAIQSLIDQIQSLSARMDEMKARMATLSQEIQSMKAPGSKGSANQDGAPSSLAPAASGGTGAAADRAFKTAYADYSKGNYELAVMGFSDFLKTWSSDPMAADAQYWIGESLYSEGKYKEAGEAMDRVMERFPSSGKLPAALLKKGYAQIESNQTPAAVATIQKLIAQYPDSEEARLGAERLKQLGLRAR